MSSHRRKEDGHTLVFFKSQGRIAPLRFRLDNPPVRYHSTLIVLALACMPIASHAENVTNWSFLGGHIGPDWRISGQATTTAEIGGLRVIPQSDVKIFRETHLGHGVDAAEITYLALRNTEAVFLWHRSGEPEDQIVRLPFAFVHTTVPSTVKLDLQWYEEWDPHADRMGLLLPKGADVQLLQIKLIGRSPLEKVLAAIRSSWIFDTFTPYSVNFLWGPIFTMSPIARERLFIDLPPHGTYGNSILYAIILLSLAGSFAWNLVRKDRQRAALFALGVIAAAWTLSDVRMGTELLSYVRDDWESYWSKPTHKRIFRERSDFPIFLKSVKPLVEDRSRYIFLTQYPYPLLGLMRYHTYPAMPVAPEAATEGVDTWVLYDRPEVTMNDEGRLIAGETPISPPGEMLFRLREGTFVFRTR